MKKVDGYRVAITSKEVAVYPAGYIQIAFLYNMQANQTKLIFSWLKPGIKF